ncbi:hypothetical protein EBZ38_10710 [bacterium]|nr:hypothetical protein [bacterium]
MNIDFPEHLFNPEKNILIYENSIENGKKIASNKNILFCGIVRNSEKVIEKNILRIHKTGKYFKNYNIFVYENNSTDNTKSILTTLKNDKTIVVIDKDDPNDYLSKVEQGIDNNHQHRCKALCEYRNKYMEFIDSTQSSYDYICIIDLDLKGGWSYDGFYNSISHIEKKEDIACVSAYGILAEYTGTLDLENINSQNYVMYDSLAFRPTGFSGPLYPNIQSSFNFIKCNRGEYPITVDSNFNGLAIYKTKFLKNKRYSSRIWPHGEVDPDHVIMHEQIRTQHNAIILMNPNMIVSYSHHQYSRE